MEHDASLFGTGLFGQALAPDAKGPLAQKFTIPPFTILDASQDTWKKRRRVWLSLGIKSEIGRGGFIMDDSKSSVYNGRSEWAGNRGPNVQVNDRLPSKDAAYHQSGNNPVSNMMAERSGSRPGPARNTMGNQSLASMDNRDNDFAGKAQEAGTGTSIFDPVLCELMYDWFCPKGGSVLDPFSGGSVRGVVASRMGRQYTGMDLSEAQVLANRMQADDICAGCPTPTWVQGDSRFMQGIPAGEEFDFILSCPPYGDLEVYSKDPADISNMSYEDFLAGHAAAIYQGVRRLKPNRFAAWVIGDFRDEKTEMLRGFAGDTITAFRDAGCDLYNDAILVTAIGSLPLRTSFYFAHGRKMGRRHQYVMIFVKGDHKVAEKAVMDVS